MLPILYDDNGRKCIVIGDYTSIDSDAMMHQSYKTVVCVLGLVSEITCIDEFLKKPASGEEISSKDALVYITSARRALEKNIHLKNFNANWLDIAREFEDRLVTLAVKSSKFLTLFGVESNTS